MDDALQKLLNGGFDTPADSDAEGKGEKTGGEQPDGDKTDGNDEGGAPKG